MSTNYFIREIDFSRGTVRINQASIGDVGHVVWDAALVLSKFIDSKNSAYQFYGKRIVELGAGTGLVGIVAATRGGHVTLTDLPELVPLLRKNVVENKELLKGSVDVSVLKWGEKVLINCHQSIDVVLIADCIYYEESLEPLVMSMKEICCENTQVFLSYEERTSQQKIDLQKKFFELVEKYFAVEEIPQEEHDEIFRSDDIHIFKMALKKDISS